MKRHMNTIEESCSRRHVEHLRSISQLDGALQVLLDRIRISVLEVWCFALFGLLYINVYQYNSIQLCLKSVEACLEHA